MSLALLGSTGTGLVWGWCLGFWNTGEGRSRRWRNAAASFLASIFWLPSIWRSLARGVWHATPSLP